MNGTIEAKLTGLLVKASNLQDAIQIFGEAQTVSDLKVEFRKRHYSCDVEQYLCPQFRVLYQNNPDVREAVNGKLGNLGVPEAVIGQYFTEFGDQPYMLLHFQHEEIPVEARERFIAKSQEVMLSSLRNYLGLTEKSQE